MRISQISYGMLRVTDDYENDRVEITVSVDETDNINDAILLAKETCKAALVKISSQEADERGQLRKLAEKYPDELE